MLGKVSLSGHKPLTISKTRYVYEHPDSPELLIKVHIDRLVGQSHPSWFERRKDYFLYHSGIVRELDRYVEAHYGRFDYGDVVGHLAAIHGVIETDLGIGLLVAAVRDAAGALAPTVAKLRQQNLMNAARREKLLQLLERIESSSLILGDLNQGNIVLQSAGVEADERFMIIDGLGERTWIPTQRFLPIVAHRRKARFITKMRRRLQDVGHG